MSSSLAFFPVDNGDMTLIELDNGQSILIDINIRAAADDQDDETPDVVSLLRSRLKRDGSGRLYVDTFLLTHPDADHISGLRKHFHLGKPSEWNADNDKIFIREMWSSPVIFRRKSADHVLCDDANAWAQEARRRVQRFRDAGFSTVEGDRILVMGEDRDGKTDDILDIVIKVDELIIAANRVPAGNFEGRLLAPLPAGDDEELEELLAKNRASVIVRFSLSGGGIKDACRFLTGGDAEVAIWERLWDLHGDERPEWLAYDILQTPHHCSWHSLSYDSYTDYGEDAVVNEGARNALSQIRYGAVIVASSKPIKKEDGDPPSERAKREYISIVDDEADRFFCVADHDGEALEFTVTSAGASKKRKGRAAAVAAGIGLAGVASGARGHGTG